METEDRVIRKKDSELIFMQFIVKWMNLLIIQAFSSDFLSSELQDTKEILLFLLSSMPTYTIYSLYFHNQRDRKNYHLPVFILLVRVLVEI